MNDGAWPLVPFRRVGAHDGDQYPPPVNTRTLFCQLHVRQCTFCEAIMAFPAYQITYMIRNVVKVISSHCTCLLAGNRDSDSDSQKTCDEGALTTSVRRKTSTFPVSFIFELVKRRREVSRRLEDIFSFWHSFPIPILLSGSGICRVSMSFICPC